MDTISKPKMSSREKGRALAKAVTASFERKRVTMDRPKSSKGMGGLSTIIGGSNDKAKDIWRVEQLDDETLAQLNADELMAIVVDISPEMSRAVWDWLRLFLAGHEIEAVYPGSERPHKKGNDAIKAFITSMDAIHGSFEVVLTRMVMGALIRGAFFAELVIDKDGRTPIDIATPDPVTVVFREAEDSVRGQYWEKGQMIEGKFVSIESELVHFIPIDPFPGQPNGRSPLMPGMGPALFLLSLMSDMKRVIRQQGYPRIDVSVDIEEMNEILSEGEWDDEEELVDALVAAIDAAIQQVQSEYANLPPDAAYIHSSIITINGIVGAVDAGFLTAVDALIEALERQATRALKMMPLLMGIADTADEGDANRQWEVQVKAVKAHQHKMEIMLESIFRLGLQSQGINADVKVRFAELRVAEAMRDTQVDQLRAATAAANERYGYMEPDEAAIYAVGHPIPKSIKEKRIPLLNGDYEEKDAFGQVPVDSDPKPTNPADIQPDPAENK